MGKRKQPAAEVPGEPPQSGGAEAAAYKEKHPHAAWCITCRCIKLSGKTHVSRAKGHALRACTEEELQGYLERTGQLQGSKRGRIQQSVPPCVEGEAKEAGAVAIADIAPYTFEFGKYKKQLPRSLDEILRVDRSYVEWCMKSELHHRYH